MIIVNTLALLNFLLYHYSDTDLSRWKGVHKNRDINWLFTIMYFIMSRMCWLTWIRDNTRAPCPCHISEPHKATSMVLKVFYYHNSISLRFPVSCPIGKRKKSLLVLQDLICWAIKIIPERILVYFYFLNIQFGNKTLVSAHQTKRGLLYVQWGSTLSLFHHTHHQPLTTANN